MPYYCTVPRCTSMAGKAKNVSFHQFPRDEELAKLWNKILKRGKPYTKYSKVCSLHFTAEDYTITSVGKNKGQWRTLRKDAVPSQNLPSESPTPYQRKQWGSWTSNTQAASVMDPTLQQQVAQAIYMQTMLAMQAARANELPTLSHNNGLQMPTEAFAHTSHTPDPDILKGKQTNTNEVTSYKCTECSKCFKDPDVFILHKRTHIKHEKNEKENFNLNVTLQANPILANLLKTDNNIYDSNLVSMESLLMTALAANMEGYMRNFTSMIKNDDRDSLNRDLGEMDHDRSEPDHDRVESNHDKVESNHDAGDLNSVKGDLNQERGTLNTTDYRQHFDLNGRTNQHREITSQREIDCDNFNRGDSTIGNISQDICDVNHDLGEINRDLGIMNRDSNEVNSNEINPRSALANMVNGHSLFTDRLLELCQNERNMKYYENGRAQIRNFENGTDDEGTNESDNEVTNESDPEGTNESDNEVTNGFHSNSPICDLNESIDSNKLVIDESKV